MTNKELIAALKRYKEIGYCSSYPLEIERKELWDNISKCDYLQVLLDEIDMLNAQLGMNKEMKEIDFKCDCGGEFELANNIVYSSDPPQFNYKCDKCGVEKISPMLKKIPESAPIEWVTLATAQQVDEVIKLLKETNVMLREIRDGK